MKNWCEVIFVWMLFVFALTAEAFCVSDFSMTQKIAVCFSIVLVWAFIRSMGWFEVGQPR